MAPKKRPRPNSAKKAKELTAELDGEEPDPWLHFTPKQRAFLHAYCRTMRISDACRAAKVEIHTAYMWRARCPVFRQAFKRASKMAADFVEEEAIRRATIGVPKKKFYKGDPIVDPDTGKQYVEYSKSDYLMGRLLEACKPEKYRPPAQVSQSTTIITDVPQQGKSLIDFLKEQASGKTIEQAPQQQVIDNGNGKPHSGNGKP